MLFCVSPGQADAEAGFAVGDGGRADGGDKQAGSAEPLGQFDGLLRLANQDLDDLAGRTAQRPTKCRELGAEGGSPLQELPAAIGFRDHDLQCG